MTLTLTISEFGEGFIAGFAFAALIVGSWLYACALYKAVGGFERSASRDGGDE